MKRIIFLLSIVFLMVPLMAQTKAVIQTTSVASADFNSANNQFGRWTSWEDNDCIITLDVESLILRISNKFDDAFKIISIITTVNGSDENDIWVSTHYNAVDKDGKPCQLWMKTYDSKLIHVYIVYKNFAYVYQGKRIEF